MSRRLCDLATVVRSKNAGPFELTLDVILPDEASYRAVLASKAITKETVTAIYGVSEAEVLSVVAFEPAWAIKVTLVRPVPSGSRDDTDIYGAQQHAPLMELVVQQP